jgi:hypothetical protein
VKSQGDFADILAQDNPDIWQSHRPAKGGETGAMFEKIIARALEMRRTPATKAAPTKRKATKTKTKATKKKATKKKT